MAFVTYTGVSQPVRVNDVFTDVQRLHVFEQI